MNTLTNNPADPYVTKSMLNDAIGGVASDLSDFIQATADRFDFLEKRFDRMEKRFEQMEKKLDRILRILEVDREDNRIRDTRLSRLELFLPKPGQ